jgi:hypothetical protein
MFPRMAHKWTVMAKDFTVVFLSIIGSVVTMGIFIAVTS